MSTLYTNQIGYLALREVNFRGIEIVPGAEIPTEVTLTKTPTDEFRFPVYTAFMMTYGSMFDDNHVAFRFVGEDEPTPYIAHTDLFTVLNRNKPDLDDNVDTITLPTVDVYEAIKVATVIDYNLTFNRSSNIGDFKMSFNLGGAHDEEWVAGNLNIAVNIEFNYTDLDEINALYIARQDVFKSQQEPTNPTMVACGFFENGKHSESYMMQACNAMSTNYKQQPKAQSDFVKVVYNTLLNKGEVLTPIQLLNTSIHLVYTEGNGIDISYKMTRENEPFNGVPSIAILRVTNLKCDIKDVETVTTFLKLVHTACNNDAMTRVLLNKVKLLNDLGDEGEESITVR